MILSVRNSLSQHHAVMDEAKCSIIFYTPEHEFRVIELMATRPDLRAIEARKLDDLITAVCDHYIYDKKWINDRTDPIIVAHSSGSTGTINVSSHHNSLFH